jgi:tetratricopeptide (TPR) repeat protein
MLPMQTADWLTALNILVAFLGVFIVGFTVFEFSKLRDLRKNMESFEGKIRGEIHRALRASHRVIAAYGVKDVDQRISLLQSALEIDPAVFNGFNSLGYAFLEKGEAQRAADAFKDAIHQHPEDKAGYFDLAHAYLRLGDRGLAIKQLRRAIKADPTAKDDIAGNPLLEGVSLSDV